MLSRADMETKLAEVFERRQARVLSQVLDLSQDNLVKSSDFKKLTGIVKRLGERMDTMGERMDQLAQAQARTERRVEELVGGLHDMRLSMEKMQQGMEEMSRAMVASNSQIGGLSATMGYALENEAYRLLPAYLRQRHHLRVTERFLRTMVGGLEINFLAQAKTADGRQAIIVGESKTRLDERRRDGEEIDAVFAQLEEKLSVVAESYPGLVVIPLLVTHFARAPFHAEASRRGVIVVQSFELHSDD
jgi:uncharacterized coiled-coil protein SlyX